MTASTPVLSLRGISKRFGAVQALDGVDFDVYAGEVVALVGDNGAGKSTLVKIMSGIYSADAGEYRFDGQVVDVKSPQDAADLGVATVYQDLALADNQPVYMNLFLGRELVRGPLRRLDRARMAAETAELLQELDIRIPSPRVPIRALSGGQRQGVAIARATHWGERLILMDEPTAALGVQETARVEETILRMKERGKAILIVSHSLDQVFRLSDRICVLRRGEQVGVRETTETDGDEIVSMITGLR